MTDQEREHLIELYRQVLVLEDERHAKQFAALRMKHLIAERPGPLVEQMERERGLRAS